MIFIGLRKDKETNEIIKYELRVKDRDISSIYQDKYGVYVCTTFGRRYQVDHTVEELEELIGVN